MEWREREAKEMRLGAILACICTLYAVFSCLQRLSSDVVRKEYVEERSREQRVIELMASKDLKSDKQICLYDMRYMHLYIILYIINECYFAGVPGVQARVEAGHATAGDRAHEGALFFYFSAFKRQVQLAEDMNNAQWRVELQSLR